MMDHYKYFVSEHVDGNKYILHVCVFPEEQGGFSSFVLNLPGAFGMGETEDEAFESALDVAIGCIEEYGKSGLDIPWRDESVNPGNSKVRIFKVETPGEE